MSKSKQVPKSFRKYHHKGGWDIGEEKPVRPYPYEGMTQSQLIASLAPLDARIAVSVDSLTRFLIAARNNFKRRSIHWNDVVPVYKHNKHIMKTATGNAVIRAFSKAAKNINKEATMTSSSASAGFIIPNGQKRGQRRGYQVFVKIIRYSDELLKKKPMTGGLLESL